MDTRSLLHPVAFNLMALAVETAWVLPLQPAGPPEITGLRIGFAIVGALLLWRFWHDPVQRPAAWNVFGLFTIPVLPTTLAHLRFPPASLVALSTLIFLGLIVYIARAVRRDIRRLRAAPLSRSISVRHRIARAIRHALPSQLAALPPQVCTAIALTTWALLAAILR